MYYADFVKELREVISTATPDKAMIDRIKSDAIAACSNQNEYKAYAAITQIAKGFEEARKQAETYLKSQITGLDLQSASPFNQGRNFTSSGLASPLVFRDRVTCDYNYPANDDLDPSEYGNRRIQDILSDEERWKAKLKLLTKEKKLRQENILFEHPRMQAVSGTVEHTLSFLGTQSELLRNAEIQS